MTHPLDSIRDADTALKWYMHLRAGGGQIKAVDIFASREQCERMIVVGNDPKTRKPVHQKCGGPRTWKGQKPNEKEVCASCGQSWKGTTEGWVREFIQGTRDPDAQERTLDLFRHLRPIVEAHPPTMSPDEWLFDLQALALSIEGHGRNFSEAARLGYEHRPEFQVWHSRSWTPEGVREAVSRARRRIGERLAAAKHARLVGGEMRIDTSQIAKLLEVSIDTARRMCERGKFLTARRKTPGEPKSPWTVERDEVLKIKAATS